MNMKFLYSLLLALFLSFSALVAEDDGAGSVNSILSFSDSDNSLNGKRGNRRGGRRNQRVETEKVVVEKVESTKEDIEEKPQVVEENEEKVEPISTDGESGAIQEEVASEIDAELIEEVVNKIDLEEKAESKIVENTETPKPKKGFFNFFKSKFKRNSGEGKDAPVDEVEEKEFVKAQDIESETDPVAEIKTVGEEKAEVIEKVKTPEELHNADLLEQIAKQKDIIEQTKSVKGQAAFSEGLVEYKKFQFEEALQYFRQAHVYLPEDENVKKYIRLCTQQLGMSQSNSIKMKFINEGRDVYNQELIINVRFHLSKVDEMLSRSKKLWLSKEKKFKAEAQRSVNEAEVELRKAEDSTNMLRGWEGKGKLIEEITERDNDIKKMLVVYRKYFKERIAEDARKKAKQLSESAAKDKEYKLEALLLQAKRDYLNRDYEKSIRICKIILKKQLHHDGALVILKKSREKRDRILLAKIKMKSAEEWKKNIEKIENASIFYSDPVVYPKNWDEISRRESVQIRKTYEPEWLKQLTQKMKSRVTLHMPENSLQEIVEMIQEQTGVNFRIDPKLDLEDAVITDMELKDLPLDSALAIVLRNISSDEPLWYNLRDGAIFISDRDGQQAIIAKLETVSYDVTDLITSFSDQSGGAGAQLGNGITGITDSEDEDTITSDVLIDLLKRSIDPASWEIEGVTAESYESGVILISQTSIIHEKITAMLSKFRKLQKLQVSIEVRFISSSEDDIFDMDISLSGQNDVPMEDSGVNVGSAIFSSRNNLDTDTRAATVLGSAADNAVSGAPEFISLDRASEGLFTEISVLDPIRASLVFHALSRKQSIKDLIAPRLTVLNNKTGFFRRQVNTHYVANISASNGGSTPQPGIVASGIQLEVRPTVSSDRKYVTLTLTPVVTQLVNLGTREIRFLSAQPVAGDGQTAVIIVTSATIEVPQVENWQLQTTAQVPDGGVLFVGGRMGHTENNVKRGVPLLSKVPILGRLFRTDGEFSRFDNLIISVRAKILIFDELENKL